MEWASFSESYSCSSTVTYTSGLYSIDKISSHFSLNSLISANLSFSHLLIVCFGHKIFDIVLNFSKKKMDLKKFRHFQASQRLSNDTLRDIYTLYNSRKPINAFKLHFLNSFYCHKTLLFLLLLFIIIFITTRGKNNLNTQYSPLTPRKEV